MTIYQFSYLIIHSSVGFVFAMYMESKSNTSSFEWYREIKNIPKLLLLYFLCGPLCGSMMIVHAVWNTIFDELNILDWFFD